MAYNTCKNLENLSLLSLSGNPLDETAVPHLSAMTQLKKTLCLEYQPFRGIPGRVEGGTPWTTIESGTQVSEKY